MINKQNKELIMEDIKIGTYCKDVVTGVEGLVIAKIIWLFGCNKYILLSYDEKNSKEIRTTIDEKRLKRIEPKSEEFIIEENEGRQTDFFGKLCCDKVSGYKGICIGRLINAFGSDQYCLTPQVNKNNKKRGSDEVFDEGRLTVIREVIKNEEVLSERKGGMEIDATNLAGILC